MEIDNDDHIILSNFPSTSMCVFIVFQCFHQQEECIKLKLCGFAQKMFMLAYPYHPCVAYLSHIYHRKQPYAGKYTSPMDGMGYCIDLIIFVLDLR